MRLYFCCGFVGITIFLKFIDFQVRQKFFRDIKVAGIEIMIDKNGKNSGHALVRFASEADLLKGLKKDKQYIGQRYIDVRVASQQDTWKYFGGIPANIGSFRIGDVVLPIAVIDTRKENNCNNNNYVTPSLSHVNNNKNNNNDKICNFLLFVFVFVFVFVCFVFLRSVQICLTYDEFHRLNGNAFVVFKTHEERKLTFFFFLSLLIPKGGESKNEEGRGGTGGCIFFSFLQI
ncbi:hypothetical protein RFI_13261 [Reticulomyxa filosa]|uniref:RRM domain-containing protein n=1 Tax=Reticulomyxa filosa TaxID=46433 RepID=X6ND68_RETFI|nr:hypothetical protein RFI_13261 [Reticulomyxa filosa]|eukprot:ETO23896.1 hypothetical protein RFI_13261 [Reticulomyxa filosa]